MVKRLAGLFLVLLSVWLAACREQPTAVPLPSPTSTAVAVEPAATGKPAPTPAIVPPTAVPPTAAPPTATLTAVPQPTATAVFPPPFYFAHVTTLFKNDEGQTAVAGITANGAGPKLAELVVPGNGRVFNGDYALATNQILYTDRAHAAGPGSLAAGPLRRLIMSSGQTDTLIDDNVVAFAWAPDGKAFAYILATDETYQLRWHAATGEDFLLAVDVPRSFSIAPSGEAIAFTRESGYEVGGEPGLYVVNVADGQERPISAVDRAGLGGSGSAWQPIWSADESSLLLQVSAGDGPDFVWAAADGRSEFTFLTSALNEAVNAAWQEANPGAPMAMCADTTVVLVNGRSLITGVSLCPEPMSGPMPGSHLAVLTIDPDAGTLAVEKLLPLPAGPASLAAWNAPGESVFVLGESAASVDLPVALSPLPTNTAPISPTVETSPDGQWQAAYGLSDPVDGGENGQIYRTYLAVQRADSSQKWTAVDEWRPYGLGLDYPAPLHWSGDGRYLYFTNRPIVDGCGLFANGSDLWRLDLTDGAYVQLVSYVGTSIALSPNEQTLAYASFGSGGPRQVILRNVATGAERAINLDYDLPATAGNLVWSPDGAQLLATVAYNPCQSSDWTHSIFLADVAAETAVPLIDHDGRRLTTLAWAEPSIARLIGTDGAVWLLDVATGDLTPAAE